MSGDFEDRARKIMKAIKRSYPNTYDVEAVAKYLAKNFGEGEGKKPAPVGRPRIELPTGDLERSTTVVVGIERVLTRGKWRSVEILACPVTWRSHAEQIASARRGNEIGGKRWIG